MDVRASANFMSTEASRKVEILSREHLHKGFCSVDRLTVQYDHPDGAPAKPIDREVVERGDAVGILVFHREKREFLLVRQIRVPIIRHGEPWVTEIVAGMIDPGEEPEESARREIKEEIGYEVENLVPLVEMYSSPGGISEMLYLYFAEVSDELRTGEGGGVNEDEDLELVPVPLQQAYQALDRGELRDAKTQIAMWHVRWRNLAKW